MFKRLFVSVCLFASACGITGTEVSDGESDRFVSGDGKSDTGGIMEGTNDALGVLQVVNTLSKADLTSKVGLASIAVKNIAAYRLGDDGVAGTADDEIFETLRELDSIPYVGPIAFGKLLTFATAQGFTDDPPPVTGTDDPFNSHSCEGAPMSQAAANQRVADNKGTLGNYQLALRQRQCASDGTACGAWSPVPLNQISWADKTDGTIELVGGNELRVDAGGCQAYGFAQGGEGADCYGVGDRIYCGHYSGPSECNPGNSGVFTAGNDQWIDLEGIVTENCARLDDLTIADKTFWKAGLEIEAALLVRY